MENFQIHLSDMELDTDFNLRESDIVKRGTTLTTFDVEGLKIGLGIGYDMSFGELATLYRKMGTDMLIYPAAYPARLGLLHWDHLNRVRAIDNQLFVVGVSPARDDNTELVYYGHSMVVDPKGRVLVRGGDKEEILFTDLGKFSNFFSRQFQQQIYFSLFWTNFQISLMLTDTEHKFHCCHKNALTSMTQSSNTRIDLRSSF